METDFGNPLLKLSEDRNPTDSRFFAVFKSLMLSERIKNLCTYPRRYKPIDFLSILDNISSGDEKVAVLKHAHSTFPTHGSIIMSLLEEYICQGKWNEAGLFARSIIDVEGILKDSQFVKECQIVSEKSKAFREFILSSGYFDGLNEPLPSTDSEK